MRVFESKDDIDVQTLIDSRMLICANSGGGKSYTARKILEESHNTVMSIVIDIEGEFKTLREKYDFLLIGADGDVAIEKSAAKLLPRKLLELNISTIIDISDLKKPDRIKYVKDFVTALMEIPRSSGLWKPCFIFLDEIHSLAGQQEKQDSTWAVIDLATRGRKRGYCLIGCTQRIAKLHKDVAAELNNVMVGRTWLDVDQKRAGDILGYNIKSDIQGLRNLKPGEFLVFGPAISAEVKKETVAQTKTTHPRRGEIATQEISAPTKKIKGILSKLSELPKEQQKELNQIKDYQIRIKQLESDLRKAHSPSKAHSNGPDMGLIKSKYVQEGINLAKKEFVAQERQYQSRIKDLEQFTHQLVVKANKLLDKGVVCDKADVPQEWAKQIQRKVDLVPKVKTEAWSSVPQKQVQNDQVPVLVPVPEDISLPPTFMRLLNAAASYFPEPLEKNRLALLADVSRKSSTFRTGLARLRSSGLIDYQNGGVVCTKEGVDRAVDVEEIPKGDPEALLEMWTRKLPPAFRRLLKVVYDTHPQQIDKDQLAIEAEVPRTSSTFRTGLGRLRTLGLIDYKGGAVILSPSFFD